MPIYARKITASLRPVQGQNDQNKLVLSSAEWTVESEPFSDVDRIAWKSQFDDMVAQVYEQYRGNQLEARDLESLSRSLIAIANFGSNVYRRVFGAQYWRLLKWLDTTIRDGIDNLVGGEWPVGFIQYEGSLEKFIPLDYLYVPLRGCSLRPRSTGEWIMSLCQALGFCFVVQRNSDVIGTPDKDALLDAEWPRKQNCSVHFGERLSVDVFADDRLANQQQEVGFFLNNERFFDTCENHPGDLTGDPAEALAETLLARRHVQLAHFTCHCDSQAPNVLQHALTFGSKGVSVSLGDLGRCIITAQHNNQDPPPGSDACNTITFLNACYGSVVRPAGKESFPALFLQDIGHRGFIGPEYIIPDRFACEFAQVFYANWLRLKHLGLALFRTRWFFAKKYRNPLGLFYTLYADPDIELSHGVTSVNL